ncbi:lamin tail domain-containing protein, partial [Candidatus Gracilibacteria bacterium]|nr:lamin tail domain-containing protein [Candidatus Gracilibacteria bacterium]
MRKFTLLLAIFLTTTVSVVANPAGEGLVISEVQIDSIVGDGGVEDDWAELYNPNSTAVDLNGYSLQKMNASGGSFYRKALSGSIPAYGFFLVVRNHANTSQDLKDAANVLAAGTSFSLSEDNIVYLVSNNEDIEDSNDIDIVDFVGFGLAPNFEGDTASPNPAEGGSIERKSGEAHDDSRGNGWDTNQNFDNFFNQPAPNPQNSSSEIESPTVSEVDSTPPVTTPSIGGGFYNSTQTVELTTDEEVTIYYTFESEDNFLEYSVPLEIATTVTLRFYSKDFADNEEEIQTENYVIDSNSPVFEEGANLEVEAGDELVILTWSAVSDENFEGYFLQTNSGAEVSLGAEALTFTKTDLANGIEYSFTLIARDVAGNETTLVVSATPNGPTTETVADSGEVIFNEIAWAGSTTSPSDEWIELKNTTTNKIFNLDGWKILAVDGTPEILLSGEIQPGELFLFERTDDTSSPATADQIYSGDLGNNGEILILQDLDDLDDFEKFIDKVDGSDGWLLGGENDSKKTLARLDSTNFRTSFEADGTPRASNFLDHDFAIASISANSTNPLSDESVEFIATVENRGLNSGTADIIWKVDGSEISRETITDLASFASLKKTFTQTFATGDFTISATIDFSADENVANDSSSTSLAVANHLVINEFVPNPEGADPGSEWIELFNPTDSVITLDGFKVNGTIISGLIESDGFFVLDNFDGLTNSADEVVLANSVDEIIDSKSYENAIEKKSFGRSSDDLTAWTEFFHPTKNAANIEENELPTAVITIQGSGNSSGGCSLFVNLTAEDSSDPDGDDLEFEWDLDNGSTSDDENPAGFYLSTGDYTVTLTVTDPLGGFDEATQKFTVSGCGGGGDSPRLQNESSDEPVFDSISAERVVVKITEVSFNSATDWIELQMLDDGNGGNGTDLGGFFFSADKRIKTIPQNTKLKTGEFLVLEFKSVMPAVIEHRGGVWKIFSAASGLTATDEQIILRD